MATTVTIDLRHVARGLNIPLRQVQAVVELLDEGNTVPFITRYRKDQTGGLDEEQIRHVQARLAKMRQLAERKQTILRSIESQGKLTEKLAKQILSAGTTKRLEDLYLPFKPKKQTLATLARTRGLEPLASEILAADPACADLDARAADFVNTDRQIPTAADALLGAGHILAEQFSEQAELRQRLREILQRTGKFVTSRIDTETKPPAAKAEKLEAKAPRTPPEAEAPETPPEGEAPETPPEAKAPETPPEGKAPETPPEAEAPETPPESERPNEVGNEPAGSSLPAENTENHAGEPATNTSNPTDNNPTNPSNSTDNPADEAADDPAGNPTEKPTGNPTDNPPGNPGGDPAANLGEPPSEPAEATPAPSAESPPTELPPAESPPPEPPPAPKPVRAAKAPPTQTKPKQKINRREQKKKRIEQQRIKAYLDYFDFSEEVKKIPPHRVLAINRGERAKVLRVKIELDVEAMYQVLDEMLVPADHPHADYLRGCARDALNRLILPSLEREIRRELTDRAEAHAVGVFAKNLRNLLLQPPVHDRRVLAVDPGYKSGCKLAALDQFGNMLEKGVIYLIGKPERREQARRKVIELIDRFQLSVVAIGNGTACRECEDFFSELVADQLKDRNVAYVIVNEAGASVYSTSHVGREEFPGYDASLRGAISIGRRLQDPLSELVKIDAANIGVGLYQHDVKAKHLRTSLDEVVESCVNYVGVDVNTASPSLLRYVSGLNQLTARRVYERRHQLGPFRSRQQLREVPGFGEATFVQAVGFLKIASGENPLDATWIHPESYDATQRLLAKLGRTPADLSNKEATADLAKQVAEVDLDEMAKELEIGVLTLKDILAQFARPGRDPREDLPAPVFKQGVLKLEDLEPGMELTGTVLNVVDFGAFVDIGMHDSGLVHVSQLADRFIRDPHDLVAVGDIVKVWVLEVDKQRRRVSLTMIQPGSERPRRQHRDEKAGDGKGRAEGRSDRGGPRGEKSRAAGESRRPRPKGPSQGRTAPGGRRPPRGKGPPRPTYRPKAPPKPIVPITDAMKTGKEPMRTFGDLAQFFQNQQHDDEPNSRQAKKKQPKKPKAKPEPQETKTPEQVESSPEVKTPEEVGTPQEVETPQETPPQATVAEQAQLPASADGPPVEAPPQAAEAKQHAVPESGPKEMAQIPPAGPPAEGPDDAAASPPPPQQTPPPGEQGRQDDQP